MKASDPFAGAKLSESVQPGGRLEQQLFDSPRPATRDGNEPAGAAPPPVASSGATVGAAAPSQPKPSPRQPRDAKSDASPTQPFDINDQPWHKDSFMLTDVEFERLHDLKLTLRRRYDLRVSKNDIVRAAVAHVCTDFERDPERSILLRAMLKKRT